VGFAEVGLNLFMKKIIIFESCRWAWKTVLINELSKKYSNLKILDESITLDPIRNTENFKEIEKYYFSVLEDIKNSEEEFFLLDRFYWTKWEINNYDNKLFLKLENFLIKEFNTCFVFLEIRDSSILNRLKHTLKNRFDSGWRINDNWDSVEIESKKDLQWQNFFLENNFQDSILENKLILNTSKLEKNLNNLEIYLDEIKKFINKK